MVAVHANAAVLSQQCPPRAMALHCRFRVKAEICADPAAVGWVHLKGVTAADARALRLRPRAGCRTLRYCLPALEDRE